MDLYKRIEGKEFKLKNGALITSVVDLYQSLVDDTIPMDIFMFHAKRDEFSKWIAETYQEPGLAKELLGLKTRERYIKTLKKILQHGNLT
ncbi:MAG: hypothetical protein ACOCXH_02210 [Cyclobacteriaceae bacterium]